MDQLTVIRILEFLLLADVLVFFLYLAAKLKHDLHMLQQNSYRNERYRRWYAAHRAQERTWADGLPCLLLLGFFIVLVGLPNSTFILLALDFCLLLLICLAQWRRLCRRPPAKKPLMWTARAKRLYFAALTLAALWLILMPLALFKLRLGMMLLPLWLVFVLAFFALPLYSGHYLLFVNWLLQPLEKSVNHKYLGEAKQILANRPNLKSVAITGSYGKTSCKMLLTAMLSEKYITLATPESVNTPMGITRIIRENLKPITEVFVCEMGAKQPGDITELCDLVQPQTGILTAIGPQHLETFGSQEAIAETKFELVRALPPEGLAVLNLDNAQIAARAAQAPCRVAGYGLAAEQPFHAEDISYSAQGLSFTLVSPAGERQPMLSQLLGRHNVANIVGAAAAALNLGLSLPQIARAVRVLPPLPHRLQLLAGPGYTIIDDAFNSNPEGAAAALEVLSQMAGGRKILITPGMVELGEKEQELNFAFARAAAQVCDFIILVGKKHSRPLQEGLAAAGFTRFAVAADLNEARALLAQQVCAGDTVLFENDLPDTYNE